MVVILPVALVLVGLLLRFTYYLGASTAREASDIRLRYVELQAEASLKAMRELGDKALMAAKEEVERRR